MKAIGTIFEETDYRLFDPSSNNREINQKKLEELCESMRKHGFLNDYAISVKKIRNGRFRINSGHTRAKAAEILGIPIKFVIVESKISILERELPVSIWTLTNFLQSNCKEGKKDYIKVKNFCETTGISLTAAISMFSGDSANTGTKKGYEFKSGVFKIREDSRHAEDVGGIVIYMKTHGVKHYAHAGLVRALSKVCRVPEFDIPLFKRKLGKFGYMLEKRSTADQYLDLIQEIYNFKNKNKLNLKFRALEITKIRSKFQKKEDDEEKETTVYGIKPINWPEVVKVQIPDNNDEWVDVITQAINNGNDLRLDPEGLELARNSLPIPIDNFAIATRTAS